MSETAPELVRAQLDSVLAGEALSKSATNRRLLAYIGQRSLDGGDGPREVEIAIDVFGRDARFNGADDSVVRVAMRSLRQKLVEHYAGPGKLDPLIFDIPKGAYRLTVMPRARLETPEPAPAPFDPPSPAAPAGTTPDLARTARAKWLAGIALALLAVSVAANIHYWQARTVPNPAHEQVRRHPLWEPIASSQRALMFVLGDLFMYTQTDPKTGRTQSVRDSKINSSDDLRAFLASNPSLAADRGLRYSTLIQKSTAVGMVQILQVVNSPGRQIEVRLRDELQADDIRNFDIIYAGPINRLGPLASDYHLQSRFRFDAATSGITDAKSGQTYLPEGDLGAHHKDYALVARFPGPTGNSIMVFTSGGRNAGLLQVVRSLTSPEGLRDFAQAAGLAPDQLPASFEALLAVSGYKQTDLAADLVELHALTSAAPPASKASSAP
ncbi:MAG: hypothetical protein ABIP38_15590 [Steroidobacteraceae bacterium]